MESPLLKHHELLDDPVPIQTIHLLTLQLYLSNSVAEVPSFVNAEPKSPDFVMVENYCSSTNSKEARDSKDTSYSESSFFLLGF